jgi:hypothetical protein
MNKILEDFLSVRSVITLGAFFLAYALMWVGKPIPELLKSIIDLLLGFWFGQKVGQALKKGDKNVG